MWKYYAILSAIFAAMTAFSQSTFSHPLRRGNRFIVDFLFKALESGPVSKVATIDKLSVAIAIGLSFLLLNEPMDWKVMIGGVLIVAGTLIIVL